MYIYCMHEVDGVIIQLYDVILIGGHLGRDKTIEKITSRLYLRNMNAEIRDFVLHCGRCQKTNPTFAKSKANLYPTAVESNVWHKVSYYL